MDVNTLIDQLKLKPSEQSTEGLNLIDANDWHNGRLKSTKRKSLSKFLLNCKLNGITMLTKDDYIFLSKEDISIKSQFYSNHLLDLEILDSEGEAQFFTFESN